MTHPMSEKLRQCADMNEQGELGHWPQHMKMAANELNQLAEDRKVLAQLVQSLTFAAEYNEPHISGPVMRVKPDTYEAAQGALARAKEMTDGKDQPATPAPSQ